MNGVKCQFEIWWLCTCKIVLLLFFTLINQCIWIKLQQWAVSAILTQCHESFVCKECYGNFFSQLLFSPVLTSDPVFALVCHTLFPFAVYCHTHQVNLSQVELGPAQSLPALPPQGTELHCHLCCLHCWEHFLQNGQHLYRKTMCFKALNHLIFSWWSHMYAGNES